MVSMADYNNTDVSVVYKSAGLLDIELNTTDTGAKSLEKMAPGTYKLYVNNMRINGDFTFLLGGVYSVVVDVNANVSN